MTLATRQSGPVRVVLFRPGATESEFIVTGDTIADPDGSFRIYAAPGVYCIGAYQDVNNDHVYQRDVEPANHFGSESLKPKTFELSGGSHLRLDAIAISGPAQVPAEVWTVDGSAAIVRNVGRVVSLDDPTFNADNVSMGLWRPVEFVRQVGGGLLMLQDYQPGLVPVVFVHGIGGNPRDWAPAVAALDTRLFQPWVLYYPSGMRLDFVSDYLDQAVDALQAHHGFKSLYVVAHSMGGLVARSFVLKHTERAHAGPVAFMMTINSPMMGMESARRAVDISPVLVPSWRDLAALSEFVRGLYRHPWPPAIPYQLIFSYQPGEGSDGVVPLESQIPLHLQDEAVDSLGFQGTHAGLLRDPEFVRRFAGILAAEHQRTAGP